MSTAEITLTHPMIITSRLLPGVQIGNVTISIDTKDRSSEGRTRYVVIFDGVTKRPIYVRDLQSGCQGGDHREGMASLLSFLHAKGDGDGAFPKAIAKWADENDNEIAMLLCEIEEGA